VASERSDLVAPSLTTSTCTRVAYAESVRFHETVLRPLGIPKLYDHESAACFTHLNVVDRQPSTTNLHLCFYAGSKAEVDASHAAGIDAGFRSKSHGCGLDGRSGVIPDAGARDAAARRRLM
jgi:hypothetical protein